MDDRNRVKEKDTEKENREYKEFLELFHDKYGAEEKTVNSASEADRQQSAHPKEPQKPNTGRAIPKKSETDGRKTARRTGSKSKADKARKNIRAVSFIALAAIIMAIVLIAVFGNSGSDILKGTWDLDGVTVYRFDGKGAGSLDLPSDSYAFTYKIKDNTLTIDFKSEAARDKTYTFTTDESRLTLTDTEGDAAKAFELTKQGN